MALREIAAHFGFSVDKSKLDEADKGVEKVKHHAEESAHGVGLLVEAFGALAGLELVRVTKEWVESLAEAGDQLSDTSEATGLSTRELQIWQFGAAKSGEQAEVFTLGLRKLATAVAGGNNEVGSQAALFAKLHIKTKEADGSVRNLADILPEIAEHFKNTADGAGKSALAQELFGRSGTKLIPLLNQGAEGVANLSKEFDELGGGFSQEMIERASEIKENLARVNLAFTSLKDQLALAILPRFQTLLEYLERGVSFLTQFSKETTLATSAVGSLSTALALTLGAALMPYISGALKFAAIYLAVDDLKGFLEGQDSEIGAILDSWFGDGTATVVREWILDAATWFQNGFNDMSAVFPVFKEAFATVLASIAVDFDSFVLGLENKWNGLVESLGLKDSFKIDVSARTQALQTDSQNMAKHETATFDARKNLEKYASAATPTTGATTQQIAPFNTEATQKATTQSMPWNMVTNNLESKPQITINVPAGTPQAQTEAIGRQVRDASREAHRQALQALEARGGS